MNKLQILVFNCSFRKCPNFYGNGVCKSVLPTSAFSNELRCSNCANAQENIESNDSILGIVGCNDPEFHAYI